MAARGTHEMCWPRSRPQQDAACPQDVWPMGEVLIRFLTDEPSSIWESPLSRIASFFSLAHQ